jgi:autotransporter translocation and assembly factor TamB
VHLTADISSPRGLSQLEESQVAGEISTAAIELHDYRWDSLVAQARFDDGRLTVTSGRLIDGSGSVDISGTADVSSDPPAAWPLNLEVEAAGLAVSKLLSAAQLTADVQGQLRTTARLTGTLQDLGASADFRVTEGAVSGQPFDSLSGSAVYEADRLDLSALELRRGAALVAGAGAFVPAENSFDFHLMGSEL